MSSAEDGEADRTDWERLRNLTDEENEANIAGDFDSWPLEDQARGCFFHVRPLEGRRWTWDMVDPRGRVVARAPADYADRASAEAATLALKTRLKAA
ncbi:MAG: hypothetical protein ACK4K7_03230 [Allosphingosinicella sp.]|uniref:hypothetical protein n=1 Tax=Allosphingosinicella sp. TaxID=2823234 RepID=UPI00396308A4